MNCLADVEELGIKGLTESGIQEIGLFQLHRQQRRGFPAFALSTVVHGMGVLAISYALLHAPVIEDPTGAHYEVRHLELHLPDTAARRAAEAFYPTGRKVHSGAKQDLARGADKASAASDAQKALPAMALTLPDGGKGKLILIQPEMASHPAMAQTVPLPAVVLWTPALKPKLHLTPPRPDKITTAEAETSLQMPNDELQLAKLPMRSLDQPATVPTPPAANTTPLAVKQVSTVNMAPETVSTPEQQPTPAAVLSASDLKLKDGTVVLPPVNESKGADQKQGAQQAAPAPSATMLGVDAPAQGGGLGGTKVSDAQKEAADAEVSGESAERIELPKNGRFGVIVVGTSLSDAYPQTLDVWSDRVAYTAYLHVGTPKAWILQYAQVRSADAASGGQVAHLEAPWPYDIVRPKLLSKDLNADALMVHGILNTTGHLENLAVAYPAGYAHASFVLRELAKWQFRPAQQAGKPTPVEILLIIPENED